MELDISDLDFSGGETHYAILTSDGWQFGGVFAYLKEAQKACEELKIDLDDPTCKVYSFSIIANEVEE